MPTPAHPGSSRNLTDDVKQTLLDWIRQGKYPAGSQLPSVPELVARLDVSRTVVREALQALVGMRLVEMKPGLGCFVNSISPDLLVNSDVMSSLLDMATLIEVASARRVIEGAVARMAAVTATADDFEELEAILLKIERLAKKNQPMYTVTPAFHVCVARATHNGVLEKVISSFNSLMTSAGSVIERDQIGYEYRIGEYESHKQLFDVLQTRDPDRAQVEMEAHVTKTVDLLVAIQKKRHPDLAL
jgi:GntR family transcriptional repressor for pyruvate dehydrogenase complex